MKTGQPSAAGLLADGSRPGSGGDGAEQSAPVIVLTYGYAGAPRLQLLLSGHQALACTAGTGLLAACAQAAAAWRQADGRQGSLSPLAAASVRSLAAGVMAAITARTGGRRWCETAAAERTAAEMFLELFPGTRFLCLHRCCPDVIYATLESSPWGVSGPGFAAYIAAYPGSTVAALAAWWAGHAAPLLAFEQAHRDECLRVRYEDLAGEPARTERAICDFLGLSGPAAALPALAGEEDPQPEGALAPGCGAGLPAGQLPAPLLSQVNTLHERLGYPPLETAA